jgi:hypothetical protein
LQTRRRAAAQGWLEPTPWGRTLGRTGPLIENRRQGERKEERREGGGGGGGGGGKFGGGGGGGRFFQRRWRGGKFIQGLTP